VKRVSDASREAAAPVFLSDRSKREPAGPAHEIEGGTTMTKMLFSLALGALALVATACGGAGGASGAGSTGAGTATTVSVRHVDGVGNVLVDSKGMALYSPQQETGGKVMCTGSCTSIWVPLTLSASAKPTGSSDVASKLGTVDRPDGAVQVTYRGKPLYTFAEDKSPGKVTGNGFHDQFGGRQFSWEVESVGVVSSTSTSTGRGYY
jgi:predicted lipoprotein with Yx(FWY)xxD motif